MNRMAGFFRNVSWLVYMGALLWAYAYLTNEVAYRYNADGVTVNLIDKDTFFFVGLSAFILINAVCMGFNVVLKKIKTTEDGQGIRNRSLKLDVIGWVKGFAGVLNMFLSLIIIFLIYLNGSEEFRVGGLGFFVWIGPIMLVGWFFYLVKLLSKKRN